MMTTVATPDTSPASQEALRSEYIQRAKDLVPLLRSNARRTDEERRLPQENIDALEKSGILRASRPVQHGGIEMDEITKFHVFSELARGCGSTGWVATLLSDASFLVSLFPDEVQAEVFADPNTHTTATLIPAGRAERDGSGFRVTGRWPFNTGCRHAQWVAEPAVIELESGQPEVCIFLMPYSELEILDDWYVSGLRGTGSSTVVGSNVFVPEERMLRLRDAKTGRHRSVLNADKAIFQVPPTMYILTSGGSTFPGMAQAAYDMYMENLQTRGPIAYTSYARRVDAPVAQHQVANAALKIDAGKHLMRQALEMVNDHAESRTPYLPHEQPQVWGLVGYSTQLFSEAIDIIRLASGAHGIYQNQNIEIVFRDANALASHALMMPTTGIEHYGRALCGLEPNTPWL